MKVKYDFPSNRITPDMRAEADAHDIHCPSMGYGFNYSKKLCERRQLDRSSNECYGGCSYIREEKKIDSTNPKIREEVIEKLNKGMTMATVVKKFNISLKATRKIIRQAKEAGTYKGRRSKK